MAKKFKNNREVAIAKSRFNKQSPIAAFVSVSLNTIGRNKMNDFFNDEKNLSTEKI